MALLLTGSTFANAASITLTGTDEDAAIAAAKNYLRANTMAIFFYDSDEEMPTASVLEFGGELSAGLDAGDLAGLETFAEDNAYDLMTEAAAGDYTIDVMQNNLETQAARSAYYAHVFENAGYTFTDFDASYTVTDIMVDGDYALIDIYEELNYQYDFCDEPSYELYHYNLTLMNTGVKWIVADVVSDDMFFQVNHNSDFDLETAIMGLDNAAEAAELSAVPVRGIVVSPDVSSYISYNRNNAANYALTYSSSSDSGSTPSFYNTKFYLPSASCMAYASQCVWAGFGGSNYATDIANKKGMDATGSNTWWSTESTCTNSWSSCSYFYNYVTAEAATSEKGLECEYGSISNSVNTMPFGASDLKGAVLHVKGYSNGNAASYAHAVFVNNATGTTRDTVMVCSYNNCKKNVALGAYWPASSTDTYQSVRIIVPVAFRYGESTPRLWGDLQNVFVDKTATRTITGYSNAVMATFQMVLYNPNGTSVCSWNWTNTSSVSASYSNFNISGEWTVKLVGTLSSGTTATHYYTLRVA